MSFKHLALTAALATGFAPAFAADQVVDLSSGSGSFIGSSPLLSGGDDAITFVNLAAGTYNFLLSISAQNITGLSASLNGQAATITSLGKISFGSLDSSDASPFVLTIAGIAGNRGAYSGELSVSSVPEPDISTLMLAGLGAIGFVAARRKRA